MLLKVNDTSYKCNWCSLNNIMLTLFDEDNNIVYSTVWDKVFRLHMEDESIHYLYSEGGNKIYSIEGSMVQNINLEDIPYDENKDILYYGLLYEYCNLFRDEGIIIVD